MSEIKSEKAVRETLQNHYIAKELAIIESYCGKPYDAEAKLVSLQRMGASEEEAKGIVARNVASRESLKDSVDRVKLASDLLCAVEFYVLDTEAKRLAAIAKVAAAK